MAKDAQNYLVAQEGPSGSNPLISDGSHDDQAGGWTVLMVAKGIQRQSWITHSLKKSQLTLSQGKIKKGDDVVVDDDDDAVRTVVSQDRVTATLYTEELFSGLSIYSSLHKSER